MAEVAIFIGGQRYVVSCKDGEEDHLRAIASIVNTKTQEARMAVGEGIGEARQLLFAALLLADEVNELRKTSVDEHSIEVIERLAERVSALDEKLAPQPAAS